MSVLFFSDLNTVKSNNFKFIEADLSLISGAISNAYRIISGNTRYPEDWHDLLVSKELLLSLCNKRFVLAAAESMHDIPKNSTAVPYSLISRVIETDIINDASGNTNYPEDFDDAEAEIELVRKFLKETW